MKVIKKGMIMASHLHVIDLMLAYSFIHVLTLLMLMLIVLINTLNTVSKSC